MQIGKSLDFGAHEQYHRLLKTAVIEKGYSMPLIASIIHEDSVLILMELTLIGDQNCEKQCDFA
jgi:hypothetical protein